MGRPSVRNLLRGSFGKRLIILAFVVATCLTACQRETSNLNTNQPTANRSTPTPTPTPTPRPTPIVTDVVNGQALGYLVCKWSGTGDSTKMRLEIRNETDSEWSGELEIGTKVEPKEGDAQSMVVTQEVSLKLHPHETHRIEAVNVACLDISKPPPLKTDTAWTTSKSSQLKEFIACVDRIINEEPSLSASQRKTARQSVVQLALWKARGTSREQWIDFLVEYQHMSEQDAREEAETLDQASSEVVGKCPSI